MCDNERLENNPENSGELTDRCAPLSCSGVGPDQTGAVKTGKTKRVYYPDGKTASKEIPICSEVVSYGDTIFVSGHGVNTPETSEADGGVSTDIEQCLPQRRLVNGNALKSTFTCSTWRTMPR